MRKKRDSNMRSMNKKKRNLQCGKKWNKRNENKKKNPNKKLPDLLITHKKTGYEEVLLLFVSLACWVAFVGFADVSCYYYLDKLIFWNERKRQMSTIQLCDNSVFKLKCAGFVCLLFRKLFCCAVWFDLIAFVWLSWSKQREKMRNMGVVHIQIIVIFTLIFHWTKLSTFCFWTLNKKCRVIWYTHANKLRNEYKTIVTYELLKTKNVLMLFNFIRKKARGN